jgi:enterochelin esterase-like enzyme
VVLMQTISAYEYARSQRGVHARMVAEQLVPEIDRRYRTQVSPGQRTVAGAGEGAYSSFEIGLRYPHLFGNVVSQSLEAIGKGDRQLLDTIELLPGQPLRIYLEWGNYDPVDPRNGADGAGFNRRLKRALETNGYDVTSREWNDGLDVHVLAFRLSGILRDWSR